MTDPRATQLQRSIEKAAVRATLKSGHPITRDELLELRVQILPASKRLLFGFLTLVFGCLAWVLSDLDYFWFSLISSAASLLSLFFAVIGVRRTISLTLDSLDRAGTDAVIEVALEAAAHVISAAAD
jgi:hypothetical protein